MIATWESFSCKKLWKFYELADFEMFIGFMGIITEYITGNPGYSTLLWMSICLLKINNN